MMDYNELLVTKLEEIEKLALELNEKYPAKPSLCGWEGWTPFDDEGWRKQTLLLSLWKDLTDHLRKDCYFGSILSRRCFLWTEGGVETTEEATRIGAQEIESAIRRFRSRWVFPPSKGDKVVIPDISAFLSGSIIGTGFADYEGSTVILLPSVLRKMISSSRFAIDIHEMRRLVQEENLLKGVQVGNVTVVAKAEDFDVKADTLSWLRKDVEEDQFIASVLELWRENPYWELSIDTNDPLVALKAQRAWIPLWEAE